LTLLRSSTRSLPRPVSRRAEGAGDLDAVTGSPGGAVFGSLLGLLLFTYAVARLILFVTAWAATARGNERPAPIIAPGPVVITQEIVVRPESASRR
jgi:hypothetical protein